MAGKKNFGEKETQPWLVYVVAAIKWKSYKKGEGEAEKILEWSKNPTSRVRNFKQEHPLFEQSLYSSDNQTSVSFRY